MPPSLSQCQTSADVLRRRDCSLVARVGIRGQFVRTRVLTRSETSMDVTRKSARFVQAASTGWEVALRHQRAARQSCRMRRDRLRNGLSSVLNKSPWVVSRERSEAWERALPRENVLVTGKSHSHRDNRRYDRRLPNTTPTTPFGAQIAI